MIDVTQYADFIAAGAAAVSLGAVLLAWHIGRKPNAYTERCLRRTIEAHEGTIANLDESIASLKEQRWQALFEASNRGRTITGLRTDIADRNKIIEALRDDIKSERGNIRQWAQLSDAQRDEIRDLTAKLAAAEARLPVRAERGRFVSRRVANDQTHQAAE